MTPRQFAKIQAEKLAKQKAKPIQKISNTFINSALHNKSMSALKTIYYLASLLEKQDLDFDSKEITTVRLDMRKMLLFTELSAQDIRNNLRKMQETSISFINEEQNSELMINLLPYIDIQYGKNIIEVHVYEKIAKLIIGVKNNYTFINTKDLMKLKNKHSLRLLPLLHTISGYDKNVGKRKHLDRDELNDLFGTKYKSIAEIERKIIVPVKKELDSNSKLSFIYEKNFINLGKGRPKAKDITIDVVTRNNYQGKLL